ncbi:MAG: CHASE domain-containing protein, partial [Desulfamplus sp.]|nr:CHASE domain-containing protein [Desulfamplus sp.]
MEPTPYSYRWTAGLISIVLISTALLVLWTVKSTDRQMRTILIRQTRMIAETINIKRLNTLTGTDADLNSPAYLRIKEQLASLCMANQGYLFIYLMGRKNDGTIFFLVDNEPVGSKNALPVSMSYNDIPKEFYSVFQTGLPITAGPYKDNRGNFVSSAVPVLNPETGSVMAVLAVDIKSSSWQKEISYAILVPIMAGLMLFIIIITGHTILVKRDARKGIKNIEVILSVAVGLTLSITASWITDQNEQRRYDESFYELARTKTTYLANAFTNLRDIELTGLAHFIEQNPDVTQKDFSSYTAHLVSNPAIQGWGWVPVVPANMREKIKQKARDEGQSDFMIWEKDPKDEPTEAKERPLYYPVLYVEPITGNKVAIGYDLGSEPIRNAAIQKILQTGYPTATDPINILQTSGNRKGILACQPVFAKENPGTLQGVVLAVLKMGNLLRITTDATLDRDNIAITFGLYHLKPDASPELLASTSEWENNSIYGKDSRYSTDSSISSAPSTPYLTSLFPKEPYFTRPIFLFGKAFAVSVFPGPYYTTLFPARAGWMTLLTGLILTFGIAFIINLVVNRRKILEHKIEER